MIFKQTIERLRAGETEDRAGNRRHDWTNPERLTIKRCSVQPNYQREDLTADREVRVTGYRVITRPGHTPDVHGADRIKYRGTTYVVDGEVAYWPDPYGRDHIEFIIRTTEGGG